MLLLSKKIKLSTKTWFSLCLTLLLFGSIVVTQLATRTTRDERSKAATLALSSSVVCQSDSKWGIKYNFTSDGLDTWIHVTTDLAKADVVWTYHIGSTSQLVTYVPTFANKTYYGWLNRFGYVDGIRTTNSIASLSCTPPSVTFPNLIIQNGVGTNRAVTGPTSVTQGQTVSYTFRTANIGTGTAGASGTVVENYGTGTSNPKQDFSVGSLGVGGSISHTFTTRWDQTGSKSMLFRADAYANVAESTEGDNDVNLTVTVNAPPPPPPPPPPPSPTVNIKANGSDGPISISYNSAATLTWAIANASSCSASSGMPSGNWSTGGSNSSGVSTGILTSPKTYSITCGSASNSVVVNVSSPPGCGSNCGGTNPPGTKPPSPPKVVPPSTNPAQQPTAGPDDIKLTFVPNAFLKGSMNVTLIIDGTSVNQNASVGKDGGALVIKASGLLKKNAAYVLKTFSKNSLVQKIGFTYVNNTSLNIATFVTGDFNNDNQIDSKDTDLLVPNGIKSGEILYDINYDGVVNSVDYSLLLVNQGKKGS